MVLLCDLKTMCSLNLRFFIFDQEEDFLIEDAKQILLGKSYHWGDWSIVLVEDYLYLWSDEVVLVLPKFSYVWLCYILDGKLAIMNSDGIPENQTDGIFNKFLFYNILRQIIIMLF